MAARSSALPGVITAQMMEQLMAGYEHAFDSEEIDKDLIAIPAPIKMIMRKAGIIALFERKAISYLVTSLSRCDESTEVNVIDAAYWLKGCSSLGKLRYAVLLNVGSSTSNEKNLCLIDIKEASVAAAPRYATAKMPLEHGERVVEGARHLSPYLGERMAAAHLLERSVFIRELLPQDMKIEIDQVTQEEAQKVARYLALVLGKAHVRQMDSSTRKHWLKELRHNRSKSLNAPSWLWSSIVELIKNHEGGYLEHCRKFASRFATAA